MKWLWRSLLPLLLVACFASFVTACKSRTPELTGKWSGNSDLSTQIARAPGSLQMQNAKAVPVQVTMTLNQNGGGVIGDAAVVISGSRRFIYRLLRASSAMTAKFPLRLIALVSVMSTLPSMETSQPVNSLAILHLRWIPYWE
jgi:hypothetical protein